MRIMAILAGVGAAMAVPAPAAVTSSSEWGFATESQVEIAAGADAVYALLAQPGRWWEDSHTYSGDSANMAIALHAGGCFCEALPAKTGPAGTVEHARVVQAMPGQRLRLSGALGPLQGEGATGTLDVAIAPSGKGVKVVMTYVVGGYIRGGPAAIAPAVDQVLRAQLAGLKRAAETPTR